MRKSSAILHISTHFNKSYGIEVPNLCANPNSIPSIKQNIFPAIPGLTSPISFVSSFLFLYASFFFSTHLFVASPSRPPCRIPDTRSSLPRLSPSPPDKILGGISHVRPIHVRSIRRKCIPVSIMRAIPKPVVSTFKIIDCPLLSVLENRVRVLHDLETSSGGRVI